MQALADDVVLSARGFISRALVGVSKRIDDLERRIMAIPAGRDGAPGVKGSDGKDAAVDYAKVGELVTMAVSTAVAALPVPANGRDGKDGKDADHEETRAMVLDSVAEVVKAIPKPTDGKDGNDGRDGRDGKDADEAVIPALVESHVKAAIAALPVPKDGKDGKDGEKGEGVDHLGVRSLIESLVTERVNKRVADIPRGRDGKDADLEQTKALVDAEVARAVAALPRPKDGATPHPDTIELMVVRQVEKAVAALPVIVKDGKDGVNGFGLEDFDVALGEDGRTLTLKFVRGEVKIERQIRLYTVLDAGVFRADATYLRGDGTTLDGCFWIAQKDTGDRPGTSDAWRLAVKKGRDGKDGVLLPPAPQDRVVRLK